MSEFERLWGRFETKEYREAFVTAQVKKAIPFQIRAMLKTRRWSQEELATRSALEQGVVSRAASPTYGNLTLNTILRVAAGFDVAFIGKFVPFSELGQWFLNLSEAELGNVAAFAEETVKLSSAANAEGVEDCAQALSISSAASIASQPQPVWSSVAATTGAPIIPANPRRGASSAGLQREALVERGSAACGW